MQNSTTHSGSSAKPQQLLLRLPDDLAQRFAQVVPSRQRSRFLLDLLRNELDRESLALAQAAKTLTEQEAGQPQVAAETAQWVNAALTATDDDADFNTETFEREFAQAQANQP
jgi:predicted transcriptional regulator